MTWVVGPVIAAAQLAATLAAADDAAGPCSILLYDTPSPGTLGAIVLAEITLAKPCATIAAGVLTLHPADPTGGLVLTSGIPFSARWQRSDLVVVADCTVTDMDHGGDLTVSGGSTPPGGTSPQLIAGGRVLLGAVTLL